MPKKAGMSGIRECAKALAIKRGCTLADARTMVTDVLDVIEDELLRTDGVQFVGLFTLEKKEWAKRMGYNLHTKGQMEIPAKKGVKFKIGKNLETKLNEE